MDDYFSNLMILPTPPPSHHHHRPSSISPFSSRKRPRPFQSTSSSHHHPIPEDHDRISLSTCRKVSVVVSIRSVGDGIVSKAQYHHHHHPPRQSSTTPSPPLQNHAVFLFPVATTSVDDEKDDDDDPNAEPPMGTVSSRALIVVKPTAFLGGDTKHLMMTSQQIAQLTQQSSEDWTQIYQYHHIVWWSSSLPNDDDTPNTSSTTTTNIQPSLPSSKPSVSLAAIETMYHMSQAIVNDIIAPGSIAHRMVIATATSSTLQKSTNTTGTSTMEMLQTQQLFGHIGQQSIARVLSSSSSTRPEDGSTEINTTDLYQQYGLAGFTVHGILRRIAKLNRHDGKTNNTIGTNEQNNSRDADYYYCTVSILEISTEGDDMLYDLLASRPFAKTKPHNGTVTLRYNPNNEYSGVLDKSKSNSSRSSTRGPVFSVTGLSESSIDSVKQFGHLIRRAYTAALHTHRSSKRGHIIVTIQVHRGVGSNPVQNVSNLNNNNNLDRLSKRTTTTSCQFVDLALAGCDDDKSSKENYNLMSNSSTHANNRRRNVVVRKSLWALSGVLRGMLLKEAGNDIPMPFRESVLTKVLQRSMIQPDSRTILMATVAPEIYSYEETMTTLRYLNRLLHRPGQVIQSPFASGTSTSLSSPMSSPFSKQPDNESVATSLHSLAEFAGQGRLLKEIVSDPRQRLAKVLQPINHTVTSDSSPIKSQQLEEIQDRFILEEYFPSVYSDPEDDAGDGDDEEDLPDPSHLPSPFQPPESPLLAGKIRKFSFSPGEQEDLVEIEEYDDTHHTAPTPPTRNVSKSAAQNHIASVVSEVPPPSDANSNTAYGYEDEDEIDTDNNMSAIYEVFNENVQLKPLLQNLSAGNADDIKYSGYMNSNTRSTNPFDDDENIDLYNCPNDILNESLTLDYMAAHVMNNRLSSDTRDVPSNNESYFSRQRIDSIDKESGEQGTNFQALEEILRAGLGEEEIVFTTSLPSDETGRDEFDKESSANQFSTAEISITQTKEPQHFSPKLNFADNVTESSDKVPSLVSEKASPLSDHLQHDANPSIDKHSAANDDSFPDLDANTVNFDERNQRMFDDMNGIPTSSDYISYVEDEEPPLTMYDLPPESPEDGSLQSHVNKAILSPMGDGAEKCDKPSNDGNGTKIVAVETSQGTKSPFWRDSNSLAHYRPLDLPWKASPIAKPQSSPSLHWRNTLPSDDSLILSNDAAQKVQDEIDQLQASVNKVKQTNISVWQTSLDSINNLRYLQTSHQEALAQLLLDKEVTKKEIQRLNEELNRRSEAHTLSIIHFEKELAAASKKIAEVESDRAEVVKIAEEAIGMQSELEQKVGDLERKLADVVASSVSRLDYDSLERRNEALEEALSKSNYKLSELSHDLDESKRTILLLERKSDNLESRNDELASEVFTRNNEVSSLNQLLGEAQCAKMDAINSYKEMSQLNEELRAAESHYQSQLQEVLRDNDIKDECAAKCKREAEEMKSELHTLREEASTEASMLQTEIANLRQELEQLNSDYSDYPVRLNEYERELSSLQNERSSLIRELQESNTSLRNRVTDVRDLTDSVTGLLSDLQNETTKNQKMQNALASFQEETRSRVEIVVRHRNEAVSLLEKTVNENKALVDVNVELQGVIESMRQKRNNSELQIRERDSNNRSRLESVENENRALNETNQQLLQEIAELRHMYSSTRSEYNHRDEPLPFERNTRNVSRSRPSFVRHDNNDGRCRYEDVLDDPRNDDADYDFRRNDDHNTMLDGTATATAEAVAAHIAYTAKTMIERNTSETAQLKEKIYTIEDGTDYEIHALKQRLKQLERRVSGTTTTAQAPGRR